MNYRIYKLKFKNGVHFGNGTLDESAVTFQADVLFSALYIEAIKQNCEEKFYQIVKSGDLRFSDAFPYFENTYTVPKPILYVEHNIQTEQEDRKKFKNMTYIPVEWLEKWLSGALNHVEDPMKNLGKKDQHIKAAVRGQEDTQLYHVGIYLLQCPGMGCILLQVIIRQMICSCWKICLVLLVIQESVEKKEVDWEDLRGRKQKKGQIF